MHQCIDAAGFGAAGTDLGNQTAGKLGGGLTFFVAHLGALQHILYGFDFIAAVGIGNGLAQGGLCRKCKIKHCLDSPGFFSGDSDGISMV